jgi:fatty-acyl-CoA synthase
MKIDEYLRQVGAICGSVDAPLLLAEEAFVSELRKVEQPGRLNVSSYESLETAGTIDPDPPGPEDVAFIQYSSGSTADPKGCMITTAAIEQQLGMLYDGLLMDGTDRGFMWLPMSHDMALFGGLLLAWTIGMPGAIGTPERFLRSPRTWMEDCAEFSANITIAPNFALDVAVRAMQRYGLAKSIPMRTCVISAERIERSTLDSTFAVLGPVGITPTSLVTAYGLAEATLAVTMSRPGDPPNSVAVDQSSLLSGKVQQPDPDQGAAVDVMSSGKPLPGAAVRILGNDGIGEIAVRSPSIAAGYVSDPRTTAERFRDGEVLTGDLGFVRDDELYVIGRKDDMLSVAGRNISARELESRLNGEPVVRPGGCALVDVPDGQGTQFVLLVEPAREDLDFEAEASRLARVISGQGGIDADLVMFIKRGVLPKTPSGKVRRFLCRQLAADPDSERLLAAIST